jgi:hypothetical protein
VPGGQGAFLGLAGIVLAFVTFGSWVAVFPGTIEALFGVDYAFEDTWGVSQLNFELFTVGTLLVVIALGIVGYVRGAGLRRERPAVPVEQPQH